MQDRQFSFRFFLPKTTEGVEKLCNTRAQLSPFKLRFISVAFGAGDTTQQGTLDAVVEIQHEDIKAAPHLSCVGSSRENIRDILSTYREHSIRRIVALRGGMPSGMGEIGEFRFANELVELIRRETGKAFHVKVAAYPEYHPQSCSARLDLENFARKVKAGADSAIMRCLFNADTYFQFADDARKLDMDVSIVPGIIPIMNSSQPMRFSEMCGAKVPRWIAKHLGGFGGDRKSIRAFGLDVMTAMCDRLLQGGASGLHFYTLNAVGSTQVIWRHLGL